MIIHNGKTTPRFRELWNPNDVDRLYFSWDDMLNGATIVSSSWTVPTDWTKSAEQTDIIADDEDGTRYSHVNSVLLATTAALGTEVEIGNTVVFNDGRSLTRNVRILVG